MFIKFLQTNYKLGTPKQAAQPLSALTTRVLLDQGEIAEDGFLNDATLVGGTRSEWSSSLRDNSI